MMKTFTANDNKARCYWCQADQQYIDYHDNEWGIPTKDDVILFEKITLESFQSGLSWRTILKKREGFRAAFCNFDVHQIAEFDEASIASLLENSGIVRHRGKIEACINNAQRAIEMINSEGSLAAFFWQFEPSDAQQLTPVVSKTAESIQLSKTLKKLGWKFVGPTTAYAFMQAAGIVNDHAESCDFREVAKQARRAFSL